MEPCREGGRGGDREAATRMTLRRGGDGAVGAHHAGRRVASGAVSSTRGSTPQGRQVVRRHRGSGRGRRPGRFTADRRTGSPAGAGARRLRGLAAVNSQSPALKCRIFGWRRADELKWRAPASSASLKSYTVPRRSMRARRYRPVWASRLHVAPTTLPQQRRWVRGHLRRRLSSDHDPGCLSAKADGHRTYGPGAHWSTPPRLRGLRRTPGEGSGDLLCLLSRRRARP